MLDTSYIVAILMTCIDVLMMSILKLEYLGQLNGLFILPLAMLLYSIQPILFRYGLEVEHMSVLNVQWNSISTVVIALIGLNVFNEKISTINLVGMLLSIIGIILIKI